MLPLQFLFDIQLSFVTLVCLLIISELFVCPAAIGMHLHVFIELSAVILVYIRSICKLLKEVFVHGLKLSQSGL